MEFFLDSAEGDRFAALKKMIADAKAFLSKVEIHEICY